MYVYKRLFIYTCAHTHICTQPFLLVEFYCYFEVSLYILIFSIGSSTSTSIYSYFTNFALFFGLLFLHAKKKYQKVSF